MGGGVAPRRQTWQKTTREHNAHAVRATGQADTTQKQPVTTPAGLMALTRTPGHQSQTHWLKTALDATGSGCCHQPDQCLLGTPSEGTARRRHGGRSSAHRLHQDESHAQGPQELYPGHGSRMDSVPSMQTIQGDAQRPCCTRLTAPSKSKARPPAALQDSSKTGTGSSRQSSSVATQNNSEPHSTCRHAARGWWQRPATPTGLHGASLPHPHACPQRTQRPSLQRRMAWA